MMFSSIARWLLLGKISSKLLCDNSSSHHLKFYAYKQWHAPLLIWMALQALQENTLLRLYAIYQALFGMSSIVLSVDWQLWTLLMQQYQMLICIGHEMQHIVRTGCVWCNDHKSMLFGGCNSPVAKCSSVVSVVLMKIYYTTTLLHFDLLPGA